MTSWFGRFATNIATWAGRPIAFLLAATSIIVWATCGPVFHWSETWQLVVNTGTTICTFLMVFLIQNSQNRDSLAIQTKLDELIVAIRDAQNDFVGIEHLNDEEIARFKDALERRAAEAKA